MTTMTDVTGTEHPRGRLVGRAAALGHLTGALSAAAAGRGATVLVGGEPGIGKSRLVGEFLRHARQRGVDVRAGRCLDLVGPGVPYLPFAEAFGGAGRPDPVRLRADIEAAAATKPLVLALEDVHWADESTLDLLAVLTHALARSHAVVIATYRHRHNERLTSVVAELLRARAASAIDLGPLAPAEIVELIEGVAGALVPLDVTDPIVSRAEGNPFFAEELFAASRRGETALPRGIQDALLQRLTRLDPPARAVTRIASAAGGDVPFALLAAVSGRPDPELVEALRDAVEHDVLVPDRARGTFRFRHALLAEAVYATLLPGESDALHAALARTLTASPGLATNGSVASELARHWAAAGRPAQAMAETLRAADDAQAAAGPAEALRHLERAVTLWPAVPAALRPERAALLARTAEFAHVTGRGQRAVALVREAIGAAGDSAALYERLGSYLLPLGERDAGLAALRRAADLTPAQPPSAGRVEVLTTLANALRLSAQYAQAQRVCDEAIAEADALAAPRSADRARDIRGLSLAYTDRAADGLAVLAAACDEARQRTTPLDILCPFVLYSDALMAHGRLADAAAAARRGLPLASDLGVAGGVGTLLAANLAEALLWLGDWAGAQDVLSNALRASGGFWPHQLHRVRAQLAVGRGDVAEARHHLSVGAQAGTEPPSAPAYAGLVAELELWCGDPEAAAAAVDAGLAADPDDRVFASTRLCALGLRAEAERSALARARAGPADRPAAARDRSTRLVERARAGAARPGDALLWTVVAEAEYGRTPEHWEAAVEATAERPYVSAYCQWQLAAALLAAGARRLSVTAAARAAYRVAVDLGAAPLRRELELLAQRGRLDLIGLHSGPTTRPDGSGDLGLTAREHEVLSLLARGYTNGEIAAELTISVKTASVHVSHILRKLGATRRTEAAALAQRLAGGPR
jgi:DNA-binding NarL/FixJ family response regulator